MTETAAGAIEYLDRLLVCRLRAINARVHRYKPGFRLRQQVTPSPRLIMVRSGRVDYHVDADRWTLEAGEMVLLPAYFQRSWTAGPDAPLELGWFEFAAEPAMEELDGLLRARAADPALEAAAIERIVNLTALDPMEHALEADAEMKAVLARFLVRAAAAAPGESTRRPSAAALAVAEAMRWLWHNYAGEDPVAEAVERSRLSPNHFRMVFRQRTGTNPRQFLLQLRMRAARFHLHETQDAVKEIARRVGYEDAFHFSRTYRRFWGRSPADDRG